MTKKSPATKSPVPAVKTRTKTSLRESLASVGGGQVLSDKMKQETEYRSEMLKLARELHNEKIKTQQLKQEAIELKKIKLQLEINSLQGYQVAVVSSDYVENADN